MTRTIAFLLASFVLVTAPAYGQDCNPSGLDKLFTDFDTIMQSGGDSEADVLARRVASLVSSVDFELDTLLDLVDVGHGKTGLVIGEVVASEIDHLDDLVDLSEAEEADLKALHAALFDRATLASGAKTRAAVEALMARLRGIQQAMPSAIDLD